MKILILNGSPRGNGLTIKMIQAFRKGAESAGHNISQVDGCMPEEYTWMSGM